MSPTVTASPAERTLVPVRIDSVWQDDVQPQLTVAANIGSGPDLNSATDNGLARAAELLEMSVPEVKNRATVTGAIEIGRHPGVVQVTFRAPEGG